MRHTERVVFFKQKTAYEIRPRDWSSDVCSSDLCREDQDRGAVGGFRGVSARETKYGGAEFAIRECNAGDGGARSLGGRWRKRLFRDRDARRKDRASCGGGVL